MDSSPIATAVILATTRLFDRPGEPAPARSLTDVAGLSLFQRTMLTLQCGGVSRFVVLAGEESDALKRQLRGDARIKADVRWLPVREFPPGDPRTWEALSGMVGGPYLVAGTGAVFPVSLVARLREEGGKGEPIVVARTAEASPAVRRARHERVGAEGPGGVVTVEEAAMPTLDVDLAVVPEAFTATGWAGAQDGAFPLQAAFERGIRRGQARILPLGGDWYQDVCAEGPATPAQAAWTLRKDGLEGFMDRHFNHPCAKWVTRALLKIIQLLR
jgi:hypothetical protein